MLDKYNFELALEKIAEKFYLRGAVQYGKTRGGNSAENEAYFRSITSDLRDHLGCEQILLKKGHCPDSGIFGDFGYKNEEEVSWELVKNKEIVVLEVEGVDRQKRYIEILMEEMPSIEEPLKKKSGIVLNLNEINNYGDFFGVEYKASKNNSSNSINVASFNSTCPSAIKTVALKIRMIHDLNQRSGTITIHGQKLKTCDLALKITFGIYYFIVNDSPNRNISEIKKIFICDGGFFAPNISKEEADNLSKQKYPEDLNIQCNLYRVGLRYRPFFDSKTIKANGYGLYTSWEPKIPREIEEERQRKMLMNEVERIEQNFSNDIEQDSEFDLAERIDENSENVDNVIYLRLRENRIRNRSA